MLIFCCCNKAITFIWFGVLMDKYSGISDIRVIGGIHKLSLLEHTGILISICNMWRIYFVNQYVYYIYIYYEYLLYWTLLVW
jgi:hypothetical protein